MEYLVTMTTHVPEGAQDAERLEAVLASTPVCVWRTDEVTPPAPHSVDPLGGTAR